jgi:uncharacterized protein (UPF0261 family)
VQVASVVDLNIQEVCSGNCGMYQICSEHRFSILIVERMPHMAIM